MKTYRISKRYNFFSHLFLILGTIATLLFMYLIIVKDLDLGEKLLYVAFILFLALNYWHGELRQFKTIVIQNNGLITFQSPIRKIAIASSDIESIEPIFFRQTIMIEYAVEKAITIPRNIEGLDDFVQTVKSMNPNIEVSV